MVYDDIRHIFHACTTSQYPKHQVRLLSTAIPTMQAECRIKPPQLNQHLTLEELGDSACIDLAKLAPQGIGNDMWLAAQWIDLLPTCYHTMQDSTIR